MVADASGTVVSELRYSAFGEIRYQFGTSPTDYLYTGQRQEAEVGLYYYVARWYDPAIGRFVQADSVVPNLGSALGYDRFAYVANNPLKYIDPSGHSQICLDGEQCVDTEPGSYAHISSTQSQYNATWHPITGNLPSPTKMNPIENMYRSGYWYGRQHGGTCSTLPGDVPNQCYHPGEDVAGGYTVVAPSDGFIYFSQMDQDNNDVLDGFGNYVILQVPRGTDSYVIIFWRTWKTTMNTILNKEAGLLQALQLGPWGILAILMVIMCIGKFEQTIQVTIQYLILVTPSWYLRLSTHNQKG